MTKIYPSANYSNPHPDWGDFVAVMPQFGAVADRAIEQGVEDVVGEHAVALGVEPRGQRLVVGERLGLEHVHQLAVAADALEPVEIGRRHPVEVIVAEAVEGDDQHSRVGRPHGQEEAGQRQQRPASHGCGLF